MSSAVSNVETLSPEASALLSVLRLGAVVAAGAMVGRIDFAKLATLSGTREVELSCGLKVVCLSYLQPGQIIWTDASGRVLLPSAGADT